MDDLVLWLTNIWDEDEKRFSSHEETCEHVYLSERPCDCIYGEMLARIAADRKILALHTGNHECPYWDGNGEYWEDLYCPTTLLLASGHKDRPGYQESWAVQ